MKKRIIIDYHWKCDQEIEIPDEHKDELEYDAQKRIFSMIKQGYKMGELETSIRMGKDLVPQEDENDGLTYSGYWGQKTSNRS